MALEKLICRASYPPNRNNGNWLIDYYAIIFAHAQRNLILKICQFFAQRDICYLDCTYSHFLQWNLLKWKPFMPYWLQL